MATPVHLAAAAAAVRCSSFLTFHGNFAVSLATTHSSPSHPQQHYLPVCWKRERGRKEEKKGGATVRKGRRKGAKKEGRVQGRERREGVMREGFRCSLLTSHKETREVGGKSFLLLLIFCLPWSFCTFL